MAFIFDITDISQLRAKEIETVRQIEELRSKPIIVQAQTGNALDARLKAIRNRIVELADREDNASRRAA